MPTMNTLLTPLLARLTSATGINFSVNTAGDIVVAADDAFKLAAFVEAGVVDFAAEANRHMTSPEVFPGALVCVPAPDYTDYSAAKSSNVTSVGVQPDFTGRAALDMEAHKLAEAGRKSWITRRANATKKAQSAKGGRK